MADDDRLGDAVQAQRLQPPVGDHGAEGLGVVAAHVGERTAHAHRAVPPGDVVDQVGERLRDRRARDVAQERVDRLRVPARIEGASHRRLADPEHRRMPAGLDVRQQAQAARHGGDEGPGGDHGQVGLDEHVVDVDRQGLREGGGHPLDVGSARHGSRRLGLEEEPCGGAERARAEQSEVGTLAQGGRDGEAPQLPGAPGLPVVEHREDPVLGQRRAGGQAREQPDDVAPEDGDRPPVPVGGQHLRLLVRERGQAGQGQPRVDQVDPLLRGRLRHPGVEVVGGDPVRGLLVVVGDEPGRVRDLDGEGGARPVGVQPRSGGREVAQGQAAAAQDPGRVDRPVVEQVAHEGEGLAGVQGGLGVRVVGVTGLAAAGPRPWPRGRRSDGDELADRDDRPQGGRRAPQQGQVDEVGQRGTAVGLAPRAAAPRRRRRRCRRRMRRTRPSSRRQRAGRAGAGRRGRPGTGPRRARPWPAR